MFGQINQKVLGSFLAGVALVAGAYVYSTLRLPKVTQPASAIEATAPARVAIAITDKDSNGVEDWRDTFTTAKTLIDSGDASDYTYPTTTTGKLSIQFFQDAVRSKHYGSLGKNKDQIVGDTVDALTAATAQELYDTDDIIIMEQWTENDLKNYANTMANAILSSDIDEAGSELEILSDIVNNGKNERISELENIAAIYEKALNDSLKTPVPITLLKQHLDLVNSYRAVKEDISAMTLVNSDPMVTFMRFKRYQDDVLGLRLSLENMYLSLAPYEKLFSNSDSAVVFANFSPRNSQP